jgi:peroxiredoxin
MLDIGQRALGFRDLMGVDGLRYSLETFAERRIVIVVFTCTGCPTVKANEERLVAIQERYRDAGAQLVAINANNASLSPMDTMEEMTRRAQEKRFNFPYLKDPDGAVAERFGALTTPHVFVLDAARRLLYKGRIDDARDPARATTSDLENALSDVFAGTPVRTPETKPFGCAIVR